MDSNSNNPSDFQILFVHGNNADDGVKIEELQNLSKVCQPFYHLQIQTDENNNTENKVYFDINFLRDSIIPKLIEKLHSFNEETFQNLPSFTKIIVDYFDRDGLDIINSRIFHLLEGMLSTANLSKPSLIFDGYFKCLVSISQKYKDKILAYKIQQFSASQESNFRIIAVRLIPYVEETQKIISNFTALSLDRVPLVRSTVIQSLTDPGIINPKILDPNHNQDENNSNENNDNNNTIKDFKTRLGQKTVDSILNSSVHDLADSVQRTAATTIGIVAPHLIDPIKTFLSQRGTAKAALKSVKSIVIHNSFSVIYDAFKEAIKFQPENSCAVLINISKVTKKEEHPLLLECAKILKGYSTLINYLHKFSEAFDDKDIFLSFLDPTGQKRWRTRIGLLKQSILFIPTFQRRLVPIAKSFSCDEIAIVRNQSVELWAALLKSGDELIEKSKSDSATTFNDLCEIISVGFHQKLVVCKVIGKLGYNDEKFGKVTDDMSKDPIPNVRICMARNLLGSGSFDKFFGQSDEPEIVALREADHAEMEKKNQNQS